MAQPAELTLGQAAKNVEDRIISLKAMAPNDYNQQQPLIAADLELKALQALFEGLKLRGLLSFFFFFFFFLSCFNIQLRIDD